jgi:hypothetical protein
VIIWRWRGVVLGSMAAAVLVVSGCGAGRSVEPTGYATANGVTVSVTLLPGSDGQRELLATFRPLRPGFHIYSVDLPAQGVDGMGIPTRVTVQGGLTAVGKPSANRAIRLLRMTGLQAPIPVYPDGPVTFTLPVRQTGSHQAEVIVSYAACSEARCLMPVAGKAIRLDLG